MTFSLSLTAIEHDAAAILPDVERFVLDEFRAFVDRLHGHQNLSVSTASVTTPSQTVNATPAAPAPQTAPDAPAAGEPGQGTPDPTTAPQQPVEGDTTISPPA